MSHLRREKLRELFRHEAGEILQRLVRDPRIGFVSVTDVDLSPDLRHVKIFVSVLGDADAKRRTMEGLERAAGFVRGELGRRIKVRYTPEVAFRLDESIERGTRVVTLLRDLVGPGADPGGPPEAGDREEGERPGGDDGPTRGHRGGPAPEP